MGMSQPAAGLSCHESTSEQCLETSAAGLTVAVREWRWRSVAADVKVDQSSAILSVAMDDRDGIRRGSGAA